MHRRKEKTRRPEGRWAFALAEGGALSEEEFLDLTVQDEDHAQGGDELHADLEEAVPAHGVTGCLALVLDHVGTQLPADHRLVGVCHEGTEHLGTEGGTVGRRLLRQRVGTEGGVEQIADVQNRVLDAVAAQRTVKEQDEERGQDAQPADPLELLAQPSMISLL